MLFPRMNTEDMLGVTPLYMQLLKEWLGDVWYASSTAEVGTLTYFKYSSLTGRSQLSGPSALCHPLELSQTVLSW